MGAALVVALVLHAALLVALLPAVAVNRSPVPAPEPRRALEVALIRPPAADSIASEQTAPEAALPGPPQPIPSTAARAAAAAPAPLGSDRGSEPVADTPTTDAPAPPEPAADRGAGGSFMERVIGVGAAGPQPDLATLDRALDRPAPYGWLFPRSEGPGTGAGAGRDDGAAAPVDGVDVAARLTPDSEGGYSYQGTRIHAEIFADGSVVLYDPPLVSARLLGVPVERLPQLLKDPKAEVRRAVKQRRQELEAGRDQAGLPLGEDVLDALAVLNFILTANSVSGVFDLTEIAMRAAGDDPYATEKRCFLIETEPLRERLRSQHLALRERRALDRLQAHLCQVWGAVERPAVDRRATLFRLWDECADSESGRTAREIIEAFVRERLPAGSADGFAAAELLALNARRTSAMLFAPYR
ncbi:MAG: hypothetical protein JXR83_03255 [Deltaproteobacteria bacterium]|nr:hypothetical protein [Deltaproteobacteria bacterium]